MPLETLRYLFACVLLTAAGIGLLRLLRVRLRSDVALLLGPGFAQAWLACVQVTCVAAGVPIGTAAGPIWAALLILATIGLIGWLRPAPVRATDDVAPVADEEAPDGRRVALNLLGVSLVAPMLVMAPRFVQGLTSYLAGALDGWAYVVAGEYLWTFARDTSGGLAAVQQFSVHLGHARAVATTSLGLWSVLFTPGDTATAANLVQALSIFLFAMSCGAFARAFGLRAWQAAAVVLISAVSGWSLDMVTANNYDNGLALSFPPLMAAILRAVPLARLSPWLIGPAMAGAVGTYPEFAAPMLGGAGLFALQAAVRQRVPIRRLVILGGLTLAVILLMLSPNVGDLTAFLRTQLASGLKSGARPGEGMFGGLLHSRFVVSAFMGLGGELGIVSYLWLLSSCSVLLMLLVALGCLHLLRRREVVLPLLTAVTVAGALFFIWNARYSYGAYKILALGWWTFAFAIVVAVGLVVDRLRRTPRIAWVIAGFCLAIVPATTVWRMWPAIMQPPGEPVEQYRALAAVVGDTGDDGVALVIWDLMREHWTAYFLRDQRLLLPIRRGYLGMPHVQALLDRARTAPPARARYLVTDSDRTAGLRSEGWTRLWDGGGLTLWDTGGQGWAAVTGVMSANLPQAPRPAFALDTTPVTLRVMASQPGRLRLSAMLEPPAPSGAACSRVAVAAPAAAAPTEAQLRPGPLTLSLPVPAGVSTVSIASSSLRMVNLESAWQPPAQGADEGAAHGPFVDYVPCQP